jgi:hypothetical protein
MLVYHLKQFIVQTLDDAIHPLPFGQLWTQTPDRKSVFDHSNNYAINELQFYPRDVTIDDHLKLTLPEFDLINILLEQTKIVDQYIVALKSIDKPIVTLQNVKSNHISQLIIKLNQLKNIMDKKHQNKMLYRYNINSRPQNLADIPTNNFIEDTNQYCLLQIVMGIISIKDLLQTYYLQLIKKLYYTTNMFNYKNDLPAGNDIFVQELTRFKAPPLPNNNNNKINPYIPKQPAVVKLHAPLKQPAANQWTVIDDIIQVIINSQLDDNIFNLVRTYYNIKLDIYDKDTTSETPIDEYMTNLLSELVQNGIVMPDSEMYVNINQHINKHMVELIDQTLQYNQIIIDTYHRWFINFYNQLKTFDCLTSER